VFVVLAGLQGLLFGSREFCTCGKEFASTVAARFGTAITHHGFDAWFSLCCTVALLKTGQGGRASTLPLTVYQTHVWAQGCNGYGFPVVVSFVSLTSGRLSLSLDSALSADKAVFRMPSTFGGLLGSWRSQLCITSPLLRPASPLPPQAILPQLQQPPYSFHAPLPSSFAPSLTRSAPTPRARQNQY
jgi:hypothetical protein